MVGGGQGSGVRCKTPNRLRECNHELLGREAASVWASGAQSPSMRALFFSNEQEAENKALEVLLAQVNRPRDPNSIADVYLKGPAIEVWTDERLALA